jgi:hypothetical protein
MSHVTNIVVLASIYEELDDTQFFPAIAFINSNIDREHKGQLIEVHKYSCGPKVMERLVFIGGFNNLDLEEFMNICHKAPWRDVDCVQVLASEQEDKTFSIVWGEFGKNINFYSD